MNSYLDYMFIINNLYSNVTYVSSRFHSTTFLEFQQIRLLNVTSPTSQQLFQYFYNITDKKFISRNYQYVNRYLFYHLDSSPSFYSPVLLNTCFQFCAITFRFYLELPLVDYKVNCFFDT